ncbi:hypothetical protein [Microcoleus vaginatus]|uniref:hypothetical protein n=1 Tax=Microcoleus vaginatus TaxID=119532 RepID=UPI00020D2417|nr:hypothetical protein MicvaDRAFT_5521 [Microcoleus vaginatus FGP-2]
MEPRRREGHEGRRKKEEGIKARVLVIKNVLTILAVAIKIKTFFRWVLVAVGTGVNLGLKAWINFALTRVSLPLNPP